MSLSILNKKHITAFCTAFKDIFRDKAPNFGKEYLKLFVDEIRIEKEKAHLTGSLASLQVCFALERD